MRRPQSIREEVDEEELREMSGSKKSEVMRSISPTSMRKNLRPASSTDIHWDEEKCYGESLTPRSPSYCNRSPKGSPNCSVDSASINSRDGIVKAMYLKDSHPPSKSPHRVSKSASLDSRYVGPSHENLGPSLAASRSPSPRIYRNCRPGSATPPRRSRREAILKPDGELVIKPSSSQSPKLSPRRSLSKESKCSEGTCMAVLCQDDTVKCNTLTKLPANNTKDTCTTYVWFEPHFWDFSKVLIARNTHILKCFSRHEK